MTCRATMKILETVLEPNSGPFAFRVSMLTFIYLRIYLLWLCLEFCRINKIIKSNEWEMIDRNIRNNGNSSIHIKHMPYFSYFISLVFHIGKNNNQVHSKYSSKLFLIHILII